MSTNLPATRDDPPPARAPAEIRLTGEPGVFEAYECWVAGGWVHAHGRARRRVGLNYTEVRYGLPVRCSWPMNRVARVRWT